MRIEGGADGLGGIGDRKEGDREKGEVGMKGN